MLTISFASTVVLQDDDENQGGAAPATDMDGQSLPQIWYQCEGIEMLHAQGAKERLV